MTTVLRQEESQKRQEEHAVQTGVLDHDFWQRSQIPGRALEPLVDLQIQKFLTKLRESRGFEFRDKDACDPLSI